MASPGFRSGTARYHVDLTLTSDFMSRYIATLLFLTGFMEPLSSLGCPVRMDHSLGTDHETRIEATQSSPHGAPSDCAVQVGCSASLGTATVSLPEVAPAWDARALGLISSGGVVYLLYEPPPPRLPV